MRRHWYRSLNTVTARNWPISLHFSLTLLRRAFLFSRAAQSTWGGGYLRSLFCTETPPLRGCWHAHEIGGARWAIASVLAAE
jgi:hypothetical protein